MDRKLFSDFFHRNLPSDMEQCIDLFAIFGGLDDPINTDEDVETLIIKHILEPFEKHQKHIFEPLGDDLLYSKLLHAISIGDRRLDSAYRRARIGKERGREAFEFLHRIGYLSIEHSREVPLLKIHPKQRFKKEIERHKISHKLRFQSPFLRFWFAFVEPFSKSIHEHNYAPMMEHFHTHHNEFVGFIFEELCGLFIHEILSLRFEDTVVDSGSYWDREVEIDLLSETARGELWIGECKWTNHKLNKKELHKLEEKWTKLSLSPDKILLFSKRGFSNELLTLKERRLYLYSAEDLEGLTRRL
jgi:hypothetical protein